MAGFLTEAHSSQLVDKVFAIRAEQIVEDYYALAKDLSNVYKDEKFVASEPPTNALELRDYVHSALTAWLRS